MSVVYKVVSCMSACVAVFAFILMVGWDLGVAWNLAAVLPTLALLAFDMKFRCRLRSWVGVVLGVLVLLSSFSLLAVALFVANGECSLACGYAIYFLLSAHYLVLACVATAWFGVWLVKRFRLDCS